MTDRTAAAVRRGRVDLARRPLPRAHRDRQPRRPRQETLRRRRDHQPDDLRRRRSPTASATTRRCASSPRRAPTSTQAVFELTTDDVRDACDVLRAGLRRPPTASTAGSRSRSPPTWPTTPTAPSPRPRELWRAVDRPNVLHQDPRAPRRAWPAITEAIAEGISVNVTLIFGLERYRAVMEAYLAGLEQARDNGHRPVRRSTRSRRSSSPASTPRSTSGSTRSAPTRRRRCAARPASPTPASPTRPTRRSSPATAGQALRGGGRQPQRPLWASTGVKNPDYATRCTSPSWSSPTPSTRCRRRPSRPSPTTVRSAGDQVTGHYADAAARPRRARRRRHRLRRRDRRARDGGRRQVHRRPGTSSSTTVRGQLGPRPPRA